jgi:hypothetical protein
MYVGVIHICCMGVFALQVNGKFDKRKFFYKVNFLCFLDKGE